jgi:class 3 adenylate cyclase
VTQIFANEERGQMFYKNEVYLSAPLELNEPNPTVNNKKSFSQNSFQYFFEQGTDRFFFGNTAEFTIGEKGGEREGTVTVGVDATRILENLAIVSHRMAFFATDKKIVKGFTSDGKNLSPYFSLIPLDQILASKTGVVYAPDGEGYFFITLHPFPKMDFYFFLLNPVADEFALVNAIDKNATMILGKIKVQTQIVIVVALLIIILIAHLLARRITKPILLLLGATAKVKEGQLDDIHLPPLKKKKMDEIETLYFSFFQMVEGLKEKEKVKGILDKVVSPTIAKEILEGHIHLGGEEKVVTVLFADIRKFSNLTEKMLPHEVIGMLNECMTRISEVIDAHGGVIDKYVGDEVMALFGAPVSSPNSPFEAVICALEIQKALENWNIERSRQKLPPIYMGIGVHTGVVLAGNMGAEKRLNYTVLGANVNLAARLCSAAHEGEILISADTLNEPRVKEGILYEASAPIELKGFSEPISLFRVKGKK